MVTLGSLWLAILLAGLVSFLASAVIWTVMPHHKNDYKALPDEGAARAALGALAPGQYDIPHVSSPNELKKPEIRKLFEDGPVGFFTAVPRGVPNMGKMMVMSLVGFIVVSFLVAYVASRTLAPGTEYLQVFRITGTVAWLAYGFGVIPDTIWFGKPWSGLVKYLLDALVYGLLTGGVFGWLWPA